MLQFPPRPYIGLGNLYSVAIQFGGNLYGVIHKLGVIFGSVILKHTQNRKFWKWKSKTSENRKYRLIVN